MITGTCSPSFFVVMKFVLVMFHYVYCRNGLGFPVGEHYRWVIDSGIMVRYCGKICGVGGTWVWWKALVKCL